MGREAVDLNSVEHDVIKAADANDAQNAQVKSVERLDAETKALCEDLSSSVLSALRVQASETLLDVVKHTLVSIGDSVLATPEGSRRKLLMQTASTFVRMISDLAIFSPQVIELVESAFADCAR